MNIIKPLYGKDYLSGYSLYTRNTESFVSNGIAWFESMDEALEFHGGLPDNIYKTGASHVVSVIDKQWGIEAAEGGINKVRLAEYFENPNMLIVCREPYWIETAANKKLKWQLSKEGCGYDYLSLIGHALAITMKLQDLFGFIRKLPPIGHIEGRWVCSAFEADGFCHTKNYRDIPLFTDWNIHRIHVHRLWNHFPYKAFRLDKKRKGVRYEKVIYAS